MGRGGDGTGCAGRSAAARKARSRRNELRLLWIMVVAGTVTGIGNLVAWTLTGEMKLTDFWPPVAAVTRLPPLLRRYRRTRAAELAGYASRALLTALGLAYGIPEARDLAAGRDVDWWALGAGVMVGSAALFFSVTGVRRLFAVVRPRAARTPA